MIRTVMITETAMQMLKSQYQQVMQDAPDMADCWLDCRQELISQLASEAEQLPLAIESTPKLPLRYLCTGEAYGGNRYIFTVTGDAVILLCVVPQLGTQPGVEYSGPLPY